VAPTDPKKNFSKIFITDFHFFLGLTPPRKNGNKLESMASFQLEETTPKEALVPRVVSFYSLRVNSYTLRLTNFNLS